MRLNNALVFASSTVLSLAAASTLAGPQTAHVHKFDTQTSHTSLTNTQSFQAVKIGDTVELTMTLRDGTPLELELERFSPLAENARVISVDANGIEHELDLSNDVHLRGHMLGDETQTAYIGITQYGTTGFVDVAHETHMISTGEFTGLQKSADDLFVVDLDHLQLESPAQSCGYDVNNPALNPLGLELADDFIAADGIVAPQGSPPRREARIIVETDYEFTSRNFSGNTQASTSYATTLIGAISIIYLRDINTTLTIPFIRAYETNNDPYGGSDIGDFLDDIRAEFNTGDERNIQRETVHGMSARNLGGGLAYVSVICNRTWGAGVSAGMRGSFPNPLRDNSHSNWDVIVVAHELGHNFGSGHTHDSYNPVVDGCGNGDCSIARDATLMSYCHLCSGGLSNIDLRFHPRVQSRMLSYLQNSANCDLTVAECNADLVVDNTLNFFDISFFLSSYSEQNDAADWNDDGAFNFFDISAYLADYAQGCP